MIVVGTVRRCTLPCAWPVAGPGPAAGLLLVWFLGGYYVFTDVFPGRERQLFEAPATLWSVLAGLVLAGFVMSRVGLGAGARLNAQQVEQETF